MSVTTKLMKLPVMPRERLDCCDLLKHKPERRENEMFKLLIISLAVCGILLAGSGKSLAADAEVFAEGAYTATDAVVGIYANITPAILSYGIKLTYDTGQLTFTTATKNESVWYLGGSATGNYAYMNPDTSMPGQVIIIGGKLDTAQPTAGVTGQRVLLGKVTFSRTGTSKPVVSLTYAKDPGTGYANFVGTNGKVLDNSSVDFAVTVVERGDANGDGRMTPADISAVKSYIGAAIFPVYADCNGDGRITPADISCVKSKIK